MTFLLPVLLAQGIGWQIGKQTDMSKRLEQQLACRLMKKI